MSDQNRFLTNQFLIAMPALADPNFFHSVTYICEHTSEGAMGIVINKPLELRLDEILHHMKIPVTGRRPTELPVFLGGPVQPERGFIVHERERDREWENTITITDELAVTTSRDILEDIASDNGPRKLIVALGYAGWGPGQLEREMSENAWLSCPSDRHVLFDTPSEQRWEAAAALLGVDLNLLSNDVGHA